MTIKEIRLNLPPHNGPPTHILENGGKYSYAAKFHDGFTCRINIF